MPDICQSVGLLRKFVEKPQECHLIAMKRLLRYTKGTIDYGVRIQRQKKTCIDAEVYGYTDSNFNGDQDEKKSTAYYIIMIECASISWSSRKQSIVDLSSCEAKYVVASYAAWIKMLLEELKIMEPKNMKLFVNNKSAIEVTNHPVCHGRSKHIERIYHFLRDQVKKVKTQT
ncbi:secreted RxLR effector protein 161-like [Vicia villosa]|uniref:secreted RxLR effector protein 161-like n=1 Tax=Vicia villosa TaxID=3911 RepID=UPI00273C6D06|nr:secreted RxLR effector protein 161-like [Vicia villosa]